MTKEREFEYTDRDFNRIRKLVLEHTGISLTEAKKDLVYGRLSKRIRQLGLSDFVEYIDYLEDQHEEELINFTNAITTNLTSFFREKHHFDYLGQKLLPKLLLSNRDTRSIRIWSAGCSTGEEPYSIAMTILDALDGNSDWDIKILATDLDTNVLAKAQSGIYTEDRISGLDTKLKKRWFMKGRGGSSGNVRAIEDLKRIITFRQLNLMHQWPMRGPFDLIFCRNVVIYFDKTTQKVLFDRYANILRHDGHLFIGHSETLFKVTDRFKAVGNTIYTKVK